MAKNRFWFQAHWLVGISVGVVLALVGVTGAMMAFQEPILEAINADVRKVAVNGARLPTVFLLERAAAQAQRNGGQLRHFVLPEPKDAAARVTFVADAGERVRFLDPYTAAWRDGGTRGEHFFALVEETHRGLITDRLAGDGVGRRVMDTAAMLLIGMIATGLYLRWPRRSTNWRAWFVIDRRLRGRGFLWSLHAVIGTYVLPLLLLSVLTGLYFAYDWYGAILEKMAGVPPAVEQPVRPLAAPDLATAWPVFEQATAKHSVGRIVMRLPIKEGEVLRIQYFDVNPPHDHATNTVNIDPASSQVLTHERYADKPPGGRLIASMLAVHRGNYFGIIGNLALMLSSLAMSLFVITGWMMYLDRRRVEARARKRQGASAAAA